MSLSKELRSFGRRLDKIKLSVDPPTLRMVVVDEATKSWEAYPPYKEEINQKDIEVDEWSMVINVEKKPD
tara:strand:+ start:199 stop:408 length:210 start_codon:yes stop_codon:yes gene_type:complete